MVVRREWVDLRGRSRKKWGDDPVWKALEGVETDTAVAADGTVIHYQSFAKWEGGDEGLPVVIGNGIGVHYPGLVLQIGHLRKNHRVITWDYRGTGKSALPRPDVDLSVGTHAEDALAVMEAAGVDLAIYMGWSMGVQVGFEILRRRPELVAGFVALFGVQGRPFRRAFPEPLAVAAERAFWAVSKVPQVADAVLRLATALPEVALPILQAVRFCSPRALTPVLVSNVQNVADDDRRAYLGTLLELADHEGDDVVAEVRCPTTIVVGRKDLFARPEVAEDIAARMPDCEVVVLDWGSHFGLIEPPLEVQPAIDALIERVNRAQEGAAKRTRRRAPQRRNRRP